MGTLISIFLLLWIFSFLKSILEKRTSVNVQLLISMMFFGGIGFAIGDYYFDSGWGNFGAVFGVLVGIELKEKFFEIIHIVYKDILELK